MRVFNYLEISYRPVSFLFDLPAGGARGRNARFADAARRHRAIPSATARNPVSNVAPNGRRPRMTVR